MNDRYVKELAEAIVSIKGISVAQSFLHNILTPSELEEISKRLQIVKLLMKGVRADISLEEKRVDSPKGVTHFLWLPVKDHHAPKPSQFQMGVACLHCCVANKINVYVHCEHGHGRAPTLVAAYLIFTGMKVDEAIAYIKKRRPTMHVTKRQLAALRRYARRER